MSQGRVADDDLLVCPLWAGETTCTRCGHDKWCASWRGWGWLCDDCWRRLVVEQHPALAERMPAPKD